MVHHPGLHPGLSSCAASRLGCQGCEMHNSETRERGGIRPATPFLASEGRGGGPHTNPKRKF